MRVPGPRWIPVSLALLAFVVFEGALQGEFTNWDDDEYVTGNILIERLDPASVFELFPTTSIVATNWAPLTILSYAVDHALWGRRPLGYHLTNVLLHALCTVLLYLLLRRIIGRGDPEAGIFPAALAAAFFAIHPVQVESVAWISERKNVLGMTLLAASFLAWLRASRRPFHAGASAAFLLLLAGALMAKAQAVILPPLLLIHAWVERPARREDVLSLAGRAGLLGAAFALAIGVGWVTVEAQGVAEQARLTGDLRGALATAPVLLLGYVGDLLLPLNRAAILSPTVYQEPWQAIPLAAWIVTLGWMAGVMALRRSHPHFAFFSLWFVGALLPILNVIPFSVLAADRYQYWAAPGLFALAGIGAGTAWTRFAAPQRAPAAGMAAAVLMLFAALTLARVRVWENSVTLWRDAVRKVPSSAVVRNNLGQAYMDRGRLDVAEEQFRAAMAADPTFNLARANLGSLLLRKGYVADGTRLLEQAGVGGKDAGGMLASAYAEAGRWDAAYPLLKRALESRPREAFLHVYLGNYHLSRGDEENAMAAYREAMRLAPGESRVWSHLGAQQMARGRMEEALASFRKAVSLSPEDPKARSNLGAVLLILGRPEEAEREIRKSLRINPDQALARSNLGAVLLTQGRLDEAEREIREALRLDPRQLRAVYNLACVAARRGDRGDAFRWLDRLREIGYRDADELAKDPDLKSLRGDPRFGALLQRMRHAGG